MSPSYITIRGYTKRVRLEFKIYRIFADVQFIVTKSVGHTGLISCRDVADKNSRKFPLRHFNLHRVDSRLRPRLANLVNFVYFLQSSEFKMGIGDYPAEYNPKVHGPYDPARFYGTPDTPLSQVKLGEVIFIFFFMPNRNFVT